MSFSSKVFISINVIVNSFVSIIYNVIKTKKGPQEKKVVVEVFSGVLGDFEEKRDKMWNLCWRWRSCCINFHFSPNSFRQFVVNSFGNMIVASVNQIGPITSSSHVFTNPESTKPEFFHEMCRLF